PGHARRARRPRGRLPAARPGRRRCRRGARRGAPPHGALRRRPRDDHAGRRRHRRPGAGDGRSPRYLMGDAMQFWVNLLGLPFPDFVPLARRADELGFAGVAVSDHLVVPDLIESRYPGGARPWGQQTDWPDAWVAIAAMAAVTTRLRFATNV